MRNSKLRSIKGASDGIVGLTIAIFIGLILVASLFPAALDQINAVDTSNWSSTQQILFPIVGLMGILVPVLAFVFKARDVADNGNGGGF